MTMLVLVLGLALVGHTVGDSSQFHLLFCRRIPLSLLLSIDDPLLWPCHTIAVLSQVWAVLWNSYFSFCPCLLLFGFVDDIIKG